MIYFIKVIAKDGTTYFYHSDNKLYWNIHCYGSIHLKTWKRLRTAEWAFNKLSKSERYDKVMIVMKDEDGNEIVVKS